MHWEYGGNVEETDANKKPPTPSGVKQAFKNQVQTPIDSLVMICPIQLWEVIVVETNRYVDQRIRLQEKRK
jgi:hypothetical protein